MASAVVEQAFLAQTRCLHIAQPVEDKKQPAIFQYAGAIIGGRRGRRYVVLGVDDSTSNPLQHSLFERRLRRYGTSELLVNFEIVAGHAFIGEVASSKWPACMAVDFRLTAYRRNRFIDIVHQKTADAIDNHLGNRPMRKSDHGRPASHRLDHDQPERLLPVDRK